MLDLIPAIYNNLDNDQQKNPDASAHTRLDEKTISEDSTRFYKSIVSNTQTVKPEQPVKPVPDEDQKK